jgi:hypothetical protein
MVDIWSDFYIDNFSTIGKIPKVNIEDGTTSMIDCEILSDIPCKISYENNDKNDSTSIDGNFKNTVTKIFTGLEVEVKKGDNVIAKKIINNRVLSSYSGIAGQPIYYDDHQEFILEDREGA